ncbi:MAG: Xaa-Pro peptidase family protein [Armatimonadota bacterium]|nr:Xaa-Pro peptidase family protein [Armatimonadota bacterium]MDR7428107.1 Xaa-Pro peptidase family protein [Armatimonadota bacterium]MDR7464456.1 Xaa-Pro peptidase family protein [Armatimonadota bacterium]MDR7470506.1 Xaa-Pro peptidase family protein [Armatimonadota bacterium]MDR7475478.1 Xaa-Pro peptidase family protein [Armatimonadota bacterium]
MERRERLRQAMDARGVDGVVASSPDNVVYSATFTVPSHMSNRFRRTLCLTPREGRPALVVVNVEESLARAQAGDMELLTYNEFTHDPVTLLADLITERGLADGRLAVELDHLPAADYLRLAAALPRAELVPAADLFFEARRIKTSREVAAIRELAALASRAHGEAFARVRPGMTERDLARLLVDACAGTDYCRPIVGSGPRSAHPNAAPTDRPIAPGDVIRVDLIAGRAWFHSDVARTAVVGQPTAEQTHIWDALVDAYRRVQERLRPGVRTADLHRLYLAALAGRGLEASLTFLGHGLGLTIHEEPYINAYSDGVLEAGMVLCLEPMYLVPGQMGFHIEDEFLITDEGFELLSPGTPNAQLIQVGG